MTSAIIPNKSLDSQQELLNLKNKSNRNFALKGLIALVGLVAGVVGVIFLSLQFAPFAIGLIIVSGYYLYQLIQQCRQTNRIFDQAINDLASRK